MPKTMWERFVLAGDFSDTGAIVVFTTVGGVGGGGGGAGEDVDLSTMKEGVWSLE